MDEIQKMKTKRGIFFSTDALIALIIILLIILVVYPVLEPKYPKSDATQDVITVLSNLKVGEINNSYVRALILNREIKDLNKTILEQIGEFYITNVTVARTLAISMFQYLNTSDNIGIWYGSELLASSNSTSFETAENVETATHLISGISNVQTNGSATGFSARVWLSSSLAKEYLYFGGYTGEGNISVSINYSGELSGVEIEVAINKDFDVYINNLYSGHYANSSSQFAPSKYDLSAYNQSFSPGENTIKFAGDNLYLAGGFVKLTYNSSGVYQQPTREYFPGIEGVINIYDGFHIPGQLNKLDIYLHLSTNYSMFMTIGNITVFNDSTNGEETRIITDAQLSSLLNYNELSQKTTPFRFGLENASYTTAIMQEADVFSVTDLSGSMCGTCSGVSCGISECCGFFCLDCYVNQPVCESCGGTCPGGIYEAKDANKAFVDIVLNSSGNRIGLVGYKDNVDINDCHNLSADNISLANKVDGWEAIGATCICCGINKAVDDLFNYSSSDKFRSIVVMSDGEANRQCSEQGTGNAKQDAIQAACDAYNNHGIIVYAVGFGPSADESTLQAIANCGNGSYYYANITNLIEVYKQIAQDIIKASYKEQTIVTTGNISTILYPDSYIEFNYTKSPAPYGLIVTAEKQFYDDYYGNFSVPSGSGVVEVTAISYSGPRWTDNVEINGNSVYNLSLYGSDYTKLGDPHAVVIPNSYVQPNNTVKITTGVSIFNSTSGSPYNKIISTIKQNASSYSAIVAQAEGCIWHLEFEDSTATILNIPASYSGTRHCYYQSTGQNISNDDDAIQLAAYSLLEILDFDLNGKLDIKFTEQNLQISSFEITGIPYIITTEVQVRRWY